MKSLSFVTAGGTSAPASTFSESRSWWGLAARLYPRERRSFVTKRLKFLVRAWAAPSLHRDWLDVVTRPEVGGIAMQRPRLLQKLQRQYLSSTWGQGTIATQVVYHYIELPRVLHASTLEAVYGDGLVLMTFSSAQGALPWLVRLIYRDQNEKEGELTLQVECAETRCVLAGLTFLIGESPDGRRTGFIGGIQGSPGEATRERINVFSKQFHGLRPKAFVLWLVQQATACWELEQLKAVSNDTHVYRHWRKRKEITADYDGFWAESDGSLGRDGFWTLPLTPPVRAREEIKPSRRKAHELRYALLQGVDRHWQDLLVCLKDGKPFGATPLEVAVKRTAAKEVEAEAETR